LFGNMLLLMASQWQVFCFVTHRGENIMKEWLRQEKVQRSQIAVFQAKLDIFERGGPDLSPGLISSGPVAKDIFKMKIKGHKGHVQLRPMLCYGPFSASSEITLLSGAIEKGFKLIPPTCITDAQGNRRILLADPSRRRHEPVA
jgi:hypothetical protein